MMWNPLKPWLATRRLSDEELARAKEELQEKTPIPVLWLLGKTGSGKSSIVRFLTGAESAEIGTGFRPQTKFSSRYDFPDASDPVMTFLDTRGLGEAGYDPTADVATFCDTAHVVIVTVRAMDHAVEELVTGLRQIRQVARERPVLLALTCLHDAYPGEQHPDTDPFDDSSRPLPATLPDDLRRSLERQYEQFDGLFDRAIPIDLTPPAEGFLAPDFGGDRLKQAVIDSLPAAYRHHFLRVDAVVSPLTNRDDKRSHSTIMASSSLAAAAAAVPVPWIDIPVVMGLQTHLAYKLAQLHGQPIDRQTITRVTGALGGRLALRMGIREALKFIPWVGVAANAAAAFAFTFASGMAWNWYFTKVADGHVPSEDELREIFYHQLHRAAELWQATRDPSQPAK